MSKINLKFWKSKEPEQLEPMADPMSNPSPGLPDQNLGLNEPDMGLGKGPDFPDHPGPAPVDPLSGPPGGAQQFSQPASQPSPQYQAPDPKKDFDLIIAKLDMIKAELDAMNQRILKIEHLADRARSSEATPTPMRRYAREY